MSKKPVLYLAPGLLCDGKLWPHQIAGLLDLVEVRIPDMTQDDNLPDMAARLMKHAPDRFSLGGLSMGGYLALEIMRQAPDRIEKLALLDTTWRADTEEAKERRLKLINYTHDGRFDDVMPMLIPFLIHPNRRGDKELLAIVNAMAIDVGPEAFIRQQKAIMKRPDSWDLLQTISCPTLVLCGADDALTDKDTHEAMAAEIPKATLEVIPDCGHLSAIEQPGAVTSALRTWITTEIQ